MQDQQHHEQQHPTPLPKKNSFWRKLGGGSLTISIILHAILLIIAAIWIIRIIPPAKEKTVDFMPSGGGGGSPASQERNMQKQKAAVSKPSMSRISVQGATSNITLPEMDNSSSLSSLGSLSSGGMSGGLGGSGSGGGRGDGMGKGFGSGTGPGSGMGSGTANPFGIADPNANALEGTYYNIDRNRSGKELGIGNPQQWETVHKFVTGGWREGALNQLFKSEKKLHNNRIYMAAMDAATAPSAFGEKADAHPRWIVVYRGNVIAPFTGSFRFVGAGDDTMVVRFAGKNVFDYGFIAGTAPHAGYMARLKESEKLKGSEFRDCPMEPPVKFYQYPQTGNWNSQIGGMAVGPEIQVTAGRDYPIEILISEGWGGLFAATLLYEQKGVNYEKTSGDTPILPLFRTDNVTPDVKGSNCPVYDKTGPVWKVKKGAVSIGL